MKKNINTHLNDFAKELSGIVGQPIEVNNIWELTNEYQFQFRYVQNPKVGAPMLLNRDFGRPTFFFVFIHPDDFEKISSGEVTPHDYIYSANWQIGYLWGGDTMIGGGYYQPFDIVNHAEEVRMYFKELACRGHYRESGGLPSKDQCKACKLEKCMISEYKERTSKSKIPEYDPRVDFFKALRSRFKTEFPGYRFRSDFECTKSIENDTINIRRMIRVRKDAPYSFSVQCSADVIRSLMMRETVPEDWDEYAKKFKIRLFNFYNPEGVEATIENMKKMF